MMINPTLVLVVHCWLWLTVVGCIDHGKRDCCWLLIIMITGIVIIVDGFRDPIGLGVLLCLTGSLCFAARSDWPCCKDATQGHVVPAAENSPINNNVSFGGTEHDRLRITLEKIQGGRGLYLDRLASGPCFSCKCGLLGNGPKNVVEVSNNQPHAKLKGKAILVGAGLRNILYPRERGLGFIGRRSLWIGSRVRWVPQAPPLPTEGFKLVWKVTVRFSSNHVASSSGLAADEG